MTFVSVFLTFYTENFVCCRQRYSVLFRSNKNLDVEIKVTADDVHTTGYSEVFTVVLSIYSYTFIFIC